MNKDKLSDIFSLNVNSYEKHHKEVTEKTTFEKWGMGILPPLTLTPYDIELLGHKRGKMLKKLSSPSKNRFKYLYDKDNCLLSMLSFAEQWDDGEWLQYEEIYTYEPSGILQFIYADVANSAHARLQRVTYLSNIKANLKKIFCFHENGFYEEIEYLYDNEKVIAIEMHLWLESYFERSFKLSHDGKEISITELANGKIHQIYPKKRL